jgi:hypothetical protein
MMNKFAIMISREMLLEALDLIEKHPGHALGICIHLDRNAIVTLTHSMISEWDEEKASPSLDASEAVKVAEQILRGGQ